MLQPIVTDTIGIVRRYGERVFAWTEFAPESKGQFQRVAGVAGTELELFQFGIRAVNVEPDAGANHDAHPRISNRVAEAHGHEHHGALAAAPDHGGLAILADRLDAQDLGAPVAAAYRVGQRRGDAASPPPHHFGRAAEAAREPYVGE